MQLADDRDKLAAFIHRIFHEGATMTGNTKSYGEYQAHHWRFAGWTIAALILLAPLVAMQFTDEVTWSVADFAIAGALLFCVGITFELTVRMTGDSVYQIAVGVALVAALILVWLSLGVGIIGKDGDPANLMYFGVLAVGVITAVITRFQPAGMAGALFATALAQMLVAVIALVAGLGATDSSWPLDILALTACFTALWLLSAWLFLKAARKHPS